VDWGQGSTLPALVAKDRTRAAELLGTGLAFRVVMSLVVFGALQLGSWLLGYGLNFQVVLALVMVGAMVGTVTRAYQDTVRGFERTDVAALGQIGAQVLGAALLVPTLLLGGRLKAALVANIIAAAVVLLLVWRAVRKIDFGRLRVNLPAAKELLRHGTPFLVLALIIELQPNIDALYLSKLAPEEVVGWHAAARRLVGILIFPAGALIAALYPTLCRLHQEDMDGFRRATRGALRASAALVMPVAIGCALYPDIGTRIFSRSAFGEAENNLRVLSLFVFFLYFSMTLGTCVNAAGLQRKWAVAQFLCVGVSVIADPILVPYFQARTGNGGLGICVATGISEFLMVVSGVYLAPRGLFDRSLLLSLVKVFFAGVAMVGVGRALSDFHSFIGASAAVITYFGAALALGGIEKSDVDMVRGILTKKMGAR
jgi:O-antigen/teichoic acid export membrane protein